MKIWCVYRPGTYHMEPSTLGPEDRIGRRARIEGLTLDFTTLGGPGAGSVLDTIAFAESRGLDEAKREEIEHYLMSHPDWGQALHLADEAIELREGGGPGCQVMTQVAGGVRRCGRKVEAEGQLCAIHAPQFSTLDADGVQPLPAPPETAAV